MKFFGCAKVLTFLLMLCAFSISSAAQTPLKELTIKFEKPHQVSQGYGVRYSNIKTFTKIREFRVDFYDETKTRIASAAVETLPTIGGNREYGLSEPVVGFTEVRFVILSLYSGDTIDFEADGKSILSLIGATEVATIVVPIIANKVPVAGSTLEGFEATTTGFTLNISELFSDPDGDELTVARRSVPTGPFPYLLEENADLTFISPSTVGVFPVPYEVRDPEGASASAVLSLDVRFPRALRDELDEISMSNTRLLAAVEIKIRAAGAAPKTSKDLDSRLARLMADNQALSVGISDTALGPLKNEIDLLTQRLATFSSKTSRADYVAALDDLKSQVIALKTYLAQLEADSETAGTEITVFEAALSTAGPQLRALATNVQRVAEPKPVTNSDIAKAEAQHAEFVNVVGGPVEPTIPWTALAVAGSVTLLGLLVLKATGVLKGKGTGKLLRPNSNSQSERKRPKHSEGAGVIFVGSPLLVANVVAPLGTAGQLTASQLQMLHGPYSVLRRGYEATGRIGYAQKGVPSSDDFSFGTGFLVTDRHVVTNRHVHGLYGHYLLSDEDPGGIEFIAEKGKDASDFVPFNGAPPLLIPELDIAIFTLSRPVPKRKPMAVKPLESEDLDGREIVVIGYPDTHTPQDPEILSVVEDDAVFAVKRMSRGKIFRHTTDTDTPYGVQTSVTEDARNSFDMPAICHNASTLGGNSGSPLLDLHTGELLGIHFAGFKVFNQKEAANLAMTIAQLSACGQVAKLNS